MTIWSGLRPLFFRLAPEAAHELAALWMRQAGSLPGLLALLAAYNRPDPALHRQVVGLNFPGPLGVAAGFDKSGELYSFLAALGFGFVECGTFTAVAQEGNPRPRLFRIPECRALVNRMGFNNPGAVVAAARLQKQARKIPRGINIGKSKVVDLADAIPDYLQSLETLYPLADYIAVNVSSPNTPGLRTLQSGAVFSDLIQAIHRRIAELADASAASPAPLFVKLAPDLSAAELDEAIDRCIDAGVAGLILTNTTLDRSGCPEAAPFEGGLSGAPLRTRSTECIARARQRAGRRLALIGVGGIFDADDAAEKLAAGADLLQAYTGFIYQGPGFARRIHVELARRMKSN